MIGRQTLWMGRADIFRRQLAVIVVGIIIIGGTRCSSDSPSRTGSQPSPPTAQMIDDPPSPLPIQPEPLLLSDTLADPSSLVRAGAHLIVEDKSDATPIHVIRIEDGAYISTLGTEGQGPGEFTGLWSFDVVSHDPPRFWAYDLQQLRLTYVDLEGALSGSFKLGDRVLNLNIGFTPTVPTWLNDSLLVSPGVLTDDGRLAYFDRSGNHVETMGTAPPPREDVPMAVLQHAYQSWMKPHPDRTLFALATFYADQIEIYRADGTRKHLLIGPDSFEPAFDVAQFQGEAVRATTDETRNGYIDLATTRDRIYALYSGRLQRKAGNYGTTVRVFDWDGTLHRVYDLNAAVRGIAVSNDGQTLFATQHVRRGTNGTMDEIGITKYRLPDEPS